MLTNSEITLESDNKNIKTDGLYFIAVVFKYKWFVIVVTTIAVIVSVIASLQMDNWYQSTVSVVPPKSSGSMLAGALGNISSTLKDFGLNKLGGKGGGSYDFMVILKSRTLVDSTISKFNLHKVYDVPDTKKSIVRKILYANMDITREKDGNYTITFWDKDNHRAADMANNFVLLANRLAMKVFREEAEVNLSYLEQRIAYSDSTLNIIGDSLERFSRKNLLFSPEDQARSTSMALAELKSNEIQLEILYDFYSQNYGSEDPFTILHKNILDNTKDKLAKVQTSPGFAGNFSIEDASEVVIEYMRLYTEFETFSKVRAFLLPLYEQTKLDAVRSTQNLFVIDNAIPAEKKSRPKRSLIVLGALFGSLVFSIFLVVFFNSYRNFKKKYSEIKQHI